MKSTNKEKALQGLANLAYAQALENMIAKIQGRKPNNVLEELRTKQKQKS